MRVRKTYFIFEDWKLTSQVVNYHSSDKSIDTQNKMTCCDISNEIIYIAKFNSFLQSYTKENAGFISTAKLQ